MSQAQGPDPLRRALQEPTESGQIIAHYAWKDLLRRGPGLPVELLIALANRTQAEIPLSLTGVARMEWHIERVLGLAREAVNQDRRARGEFPILYHTAGDAWVTHLYRDLKAGAEEGDWEACETPTPALICACGRYLVELVAPHPL